MLMKARKKEKAGRRKRINGQEGRGGRRKECP